jgi:Outer membrane protein beta-barrel domain
MKKIFLLFVCCITVSFLMAQEAPETPKKKKPADLSGRANDHFLLQLGYTGWAGTVDSIHTGGLSKSVNVYLMFDFPFKTNPKLSMAVGAGVSTDQIKFKKTYVGIKDQTTTLRFTDQSDTNHFKRTKLATAYLEAPIEFRYTADPANSDKSFKFAIGVKVGTMINAHTRNKDMETASGSTINQYTMKESSKRFFNTTRLSGQARVGYGHFSLYGSYQITALFKDGVAPAIRPYSIGLTLSGL